MTDEEKIKSLEMALYSITKKMQKAQDEFQGIIYEHGGDMADFHFRDTIYSAGVLAAFSLGLDRIEEIDQEIESFLQA